MTSFLENLNSFASTNLSTDIETEFITYANDVLFPYWIEREYERNVKQEIINKVKRGEYTIENGKKIVCGKILYINSEVVYSEIYSPKFKINNELINKLLDMGFGLNSYGSKLPTPIIIYPQHGGYFIFRVKSSPNYASTNIKFDHGNIIKKTENRSFTHIERVGLFKRKKECVYERKVDTYELCDELKVICKAFADRGKQDAVEIAFELKGYSDYNPIATLRNFDEKVITDFSTFYSEKDHISESCLTYRVEF